MNCFRHRFFRHLKVLIYKNLVTKVIINQTSLHYQIRKPLSFLIELSVPLQFVLFLWLITFIMPGHEQGNQSTLLDSFDQFQKCKS